MKKILSVAALLAVIGVSLAGCDTTTSSTTSNSGTSSATTTTSETPQPDPVVTAFAVNTSVGEGASVTIVSEPNEDNKFEAGTSVEFSITLANELVELVNVTVSDTNLVKLENGNYSFIMPNKDTTITVTTASLGDGSLLEVSDVKQEDVPTNIEGVETALTRASAVEGTYLKSAVLDSTYDYDYDAITHFEIEAGRNNILLMHGYTKSSLTSSINEYENIQRGLYDEGHYYEISSSVSYSTYNVEPSFSLVVEDPQLEEGESLPSLPSGQIYASEASQLVSSYGLADLVLSEFFEDGGFGYYWTDLTVNSTLSQDRKNYTVTVDADYVNYSDEYTNPVMELNFDGDGFLNYVHLTVSEYGEGVFNSELGELEEGAEPIDVTHFNIDAVRGYKDIAEPFFNPTDYAASNYDVDVYMTVEGSSAALVEDATVEVGSSLTFSYTVKDHHPWVAGGTLIGASEEGFIEVSGTSVSVLKEGTFDLYFDNGLGQIKTVTLTAIAAQPHVIEFSLTNNSRIYTNEANELTVSILPQQASQDVTLTVSEDSQVQATIAEGSEAGTFTVTPISDGTLTLVATSTVNTQLSETLTLTCVTRPSVTGVTETLNTYSITGTHPNYGDIMLFTFYDDLTGGYRSSSSSGSTVGDIVEFTYVINEADLTISLTPTTTTTSSYGNRLPETISIDSNTTFSYEGGSEWSPWTINLSTTERVDLLGKELPPLTATAIEEFLVSGTFNRYYSYSYMEYTINFNTDGTGVLVSNDGYDDYYDTFTWSVDETTLAITITMDNADPSYTLVSVEVSNDLTSINVEINDGIHASDVLDIDIGEREEITVPEA